MKARSNNACGAIKSRFLNKFKGLIKFFDQCPIQSQIELLKHIEISFIKLICEISLNLLYNRVPLTAPCIKSLNKYKSLLSYYSNRNISLHKKVKNLKKNSSKHRLFIVKIFKCVRAYL